MNKFVNVGCSTSWIEVFRLVPGIEAAWVKRSSEGQQQAEWEAAAEVVDEADAVVAEDFGCALRVPGSAGHAKSSSMSGLPLQWIPQMPPQASPGSDASCVPPPHLVQCRVLGGAAAGSSRVGRLQVCQVCCLQGDDRPAHQRRAQEPLRSVRKQVLELRQGPLPVLLQLQGVQQGAVVVALDDEDGDLRAGSSHFPDREVTRAPITTRRLWLRRELSNELVEAAGELVRLGIPVSPCLRRSRAAVAAAWN
jgi:hypothetical protein